MDVANSINYATAASYAPTGALASLTNGTSLISTFYYNGRLQPCRISVKSSGTAPTSCTDAANVGNVLDFEYDFALGVSNNGNVMKIINRRDTGRSITYQYDELNRIKSAVTDAASGANCWGQLFGSMSGSTYVSGYDPWANLRTITPDPSRPGCSVNILALTISNANKIIDPGYGYDSAGNMIADGSYSYSYDAENRLATAAGVTYLYDGDGKRVKKSNGKLYWYGMGSDANTETDLTGNSPVEYIFFGGKRIARRDSAGAVSYYFADHLGSSRVVTNAAGTILDDSDFYPFGGERVVSSSSGNAYKFTSKERDTESSLDFFNARYYSPGLARFLSADPENAGALEEDPQRWNGYSYARNNPLLYSDPDGTDVRICVEGAKECYSLTDDQYKDLLKAQQGQQGVTLPEGKFPTGDILCGGQKCGTVQYFEPGLESANGMNMLIGGAIGGLVRGGVSVLEGLFGGAGRQVAGQAASGAAGSATAGSGSGAAEQVIVSGTKATVREALERGAVSSAQKAAVKSALNRAGSNATVRLEKLADGSLRIVTQRAGRDGFQAVEKVVDAGGKTVSVVQKAYDTAGNLVHVDPKFP